MKFKLKTAGFFTFVLFLMFTAGIVLAASSCCFAGQLKTAGTESSSTQASSSETSAETAGQNGQSAIDTEPAQETEENIEQNDLSDLIIVDSPAPGQAVTSPLIITGKARGTWYFEADFPIKLFDAYGNLIASHYGQAQGEWMTEDFVPFVAEIVFETPGTETGTLVLEKDNPSGLAENDAKIEIPVRFE